MAIKTTCMSPQESLQLKYDLLRKECEEAKAELKRFKENEKLYNEAFNMGEQLMVVKKGMMDAGVPEEDAMQIILTGVLGGMKC